MAKISKTHHKTKKGVVKKNPSLEHSIGNWKLTQKIERKAQWKYAKTGNKTIIVDGVPVMKIPVGKKSSIAEPIYPIYPGDKKIPSVEVEDERELVIDGYKNLRRPVWINKVTTSKLMIASNWNGSKWNVKIKVKGDWFKHDVGSHPMYKYAVKIANDFMKKKQNV